MQCETAMPQMERRFLHLIRLLDHGVRTCLGGKGNNAVRQGRSAVSREPYTHHFDAVIEQECVCPLHTSMNMLLQNYPSCARVNIPPLRHRPCQEVRRGELGIL